LMSKGWNNGLESEPVTTYVDETTKTVWRDHAENLGMSLSEFVESMVNAGRAEYDETSPEGYENEDPVSARRELEALRQRLDVAERDDGGADPVGVFGELGDEYVTVGALSENFDATEDEVYEALQRLIQEGLVEYDTMRNAYRRA